MVQKVFIHFAQLVEQFVERHYNVYLRLCCVTELWEWLLTNVKDTEMKLHIIGVSFVVKNFDFYFECCLGKIVLRETDSLPKICSVI